jgi:hypothetical protein
MSAQEASHAEENPEIVAEATEEMRVFCRLILSADDPLAVMLKIKPLITDPSINGGEPPPYLIYATNVAMQLRRCERRHMRGTAS